MAEKRLELPQGTLDLLILKAIGLEPLHGSLYPALHRLERRGWVKAKWAISENNRRAKYYELTAQGRKQLEAETAAWRKLTSAVDHILDMA
jgi:PadR family transcriptional regulator PadR